MNGKKRTTTRDIAKACFVSQSAVSMILSGREDIHFAPETIERVKRTAKEMGYEYRGRAKKKKTGTNDTIMIMCPSLATQYYTTLIQFITQEAQEHGLYTLIAYTNRSKEREEYYLNMASDTGFYGIIYTYAPRAVSSLNHLYEITDIELKEKIAFEKRKKECIEKFGNVNGELIALHKLKIGMSKEMCKKSWGIPIWSNKTTNENGTIERWYYGFDYSLFFVGNELKQIEQ